MDFILGFGKIFGFILLGIIGVIVSAFVYFKVFNRDGNLGFQDFIIDRMAGKKPVQKPSFVQPVPAEPIVPLRREEKPQMDILANIASSSQVSDTPKEEITEPSPEAPSETPVTQESNIPDWLKESTSLSSRSETENIVVPLETAPSEEIEAVPPSETGTPADTASKSEDSVPGLPDWLKGTGMDTTTQEEVSLENPPEETKEEPKTPDEDMSGLPAWMQGVDQKSLKEEVEEEIQSTSTAEEKKDAASYEDIPDWLKNTTTVAIVSDDASQKVPEGIVSVESSHEEKTESKQKHGPSSKKPPKTPSVKEEGNTDVSGAEDTIPPSRPKRKKPAPVVSE